MKTQYKSYIDLLIKWNKQMNLTAITDPNEMYTKHILDSLSIAPLLKGERILDVGSGAGLPGLILALDQPQRQFTLLDAREKRVRFLQQAKSVLALTNVDVVHSRIEQYHPERCFDMICSRAFGSLNSMLALSQHCCCPDGAFLAMKGQYPESELAECQLAPEAVTVTPLDVPGLGAERHAVVIAKRGLIND